ncbi:hypothetical protein ACRRTK_024243 [Alexandromys fortis]
MLSRLSYLKQQLKAVTALHIWTGQVQTSSSAVLTVYQSSFTFLRKPPDDGTLEFFAISKKKLTMSA